MKRELKVGDRVIAYGREWVSCEGFKNLIGTVTGVSPEQLSVTLDNNVATYICHPKQCRRLVKKKRQEVEVLGFDTCDGDFHLIVSPEISIYKGMKLREVKRK